MTRMSNIEKNVMTSVAVIYASRRLTGGTALKMYALFLSLVGIVFYVSLPHVFENLSVVAQGGITSVGFFTVSAILSTTFLVQVAVLLGVLSSLSLFADAVRSLTHSRSVAA